MGIGRLSGPREGKGKGGPKTTSKEKGEKSAGGAGYRFNGKTGQRGFLIQVVITKRGGKKSIGNLEQLAESWEVGTGQLSQKWKWAWGQGKK